MFMAHPLPVHPASAGSPEYGDINVKLAGQTSCSNAKNEFRRDKRSQSVNIRRQHASSLVFSVVNGLSQKKPNVQSVVRHIGYDRSSAGIHEKGYVKTNQESIMTARSRTRRVA